MDDKARKHRRDSGLGSTYLSGGKWYYQWTDPVTHKTVARSSGSTDRTVAESKLRDMLTRVGKGETDPGAVDKLTVQNLLGDLLPDYDVSNFPTLAACE